MKKIINLSVIIFLIFYALPVSAVSVSVSPDTLIKGSFSSIYYYGNDGNRCAFPNEKIFFTWYDDFSSVQTISDEELASMPLAGNVTYRPGVKMIKLTTVPKVYAVARGGVLRWVSSEEVAEGLYGPDWNTKIDDLSDSFYGNYTTGEDILSSDDFDATAETDLVQTIGYDKGIDSEDSQTEASQTEEGLVAHWDFDEGQGSVLGDSSDNEYDGVIYGASWVTGIEGNALSFDGADDYVEIINTDEINNLDYGTISMWFKYDSLEEREFLPIMSLGEVSGEDPTSNLVVEIGHFDHGAAPDKKLYYTLYSNSTDPVLCFDSNQNLEEDTWYHFAAVNSPTGNTGYLNGVELSDRHYNFSTSADTRFFSSLAITDAFRIGYGWFGIDKEFHYFRGVIDEVRIYDRVLSSEEVSELSN